MDVIGKRLRTDIYTRSTGEDTLFRSDLAFEDGEIKNLEGVIATNMWYNLAVEVC